MKVSEPPPRAIAVSHQPYCRPVGQILGAGAGFLGAPHHVHHLSQIGLAASLAYLQSDGTLAVNRTADYLRAFVFFHRLGLAGEH